MKTDMKSNGGDGFTLIELLVVIAIIAIIVAIFFPVFASAREKARQIACVSSEHQLGLAITQYEQDYDEMTVLGDNQYGYAIGWGGNLYPYVKSAAVFICPDDTTKYPTSSYAYNSNLENYTTSRQTTSGYVQLPITLAQMISPARTVQLFEVQGNQNTGTTSACSVATEDYYHYQCTPAGNGLSTNNCLNGLGMPSSGGALRYATGWMYNSLIDGGKDVWYASRTGRHLGGSNFVMCDGHAKWMMPSSVGAGLDALPGNIQSILPVPDGQNACGGVPTPTKSAPATDCSLPQLGATFAFH